MYYYEVLVASPRYHGDKPLTYQAAETLPIGTIVVAPMQRQRVMGVITKKVPKPSFNTKLLENADRGEPLPTELIRLIFWLQNYYPAPLGQLLGLVLPASLLQNTRLKDKEVALQEPLPLPALTDEQTMALQTIRKNPRKTILLHGDTGTGKTRVYLELAKQNLERHKSTIVLTPEIGLTSQLTQAFEQAFPGKVQLLHSNLTPAQRRQTWLTILNTKSPQIVIGPRSALFSPLREVGLIVVDEVHDGAYKQEQAPYYQTTRVAAKLGELHQATTIFGSATPLVSDVYTFRSKDLPIIRMQQLAKPSQTTTKITVVDLHDRELFNRSSWLSEPLLQAIQEKLSKQQQSLLFLNRRGSARLVMCQVCGWEAHCPRCDLPLTYHADGHRMQCHTCGFAQAAPINCPTCQATDIVFKSIGTKSLFAEVQRLFPEARIARFDSDTKKADRLESQYEVVQSGKIDILVGTQMLGKGLDLPHLGLVGMVMADSSLVFPDYTAEERTFQLVSQLLGRVNRGHIEGHAVIQTYHPEHPIFAAAMTKDYTAFYEQQIKQREQFRFPPFVYSLKLECRRASSKSAEQAAQQLNADLKTSYKGVEIIGPSPAFIEKRDNQFYWQLVVLSKGRGKLLDIIKHLPSNWSYDIDPSHLL